MNQRKQNKFITYGALLTTLTVIFQTAPITLPMVGLLLSPFSTIPIAIATASSLFLGISVFFAACFLVVLISFQEFLILFFTTGLLGLTLGSLLIRRSRLFSIFFSTIALTLGLLTLTFIFSIESFSEFSSSLTPFTLITIYTSFSFLYSTTMSIFITRLFKHLHKLGVTFKL